MARIPNIEHLGAMFMMVGHIIETNLDTGVRRSPGVMRAMFNVTSRGGRDWMHINQLCNVSAYNLADLNGLYCGDDDRVALRFTKPHRQVIIQSDSSTSLATFLDAVRSGSRQQRATLDNDYDPHMADFVSFSCYESLLESDLGSNLTQLALENVDLTMLDDQIGRMPVSYVNLSGSKLDLSVRTTAWDWMSMDPICNTLTILVLNSVNLVHIPFEILFLKKLQTLSLASNRLKYLPHYLGDLKELDSLFIDNNTLTHLPICLKDRTFKHFNITKNGLEKYVMELHLNSQRKPLLNKQSSKNPAPEKLLYLSLFAIINNCPKFKRQNLAQSMCNCFNLVYRCPDCSHLMIPEYNSGIYEFSHALTINLVTNIIIPWESFVCTNSKCPSLILYFQNLV